MALGHRPAGDIGEVEIDDPTISYVVPGAFDSGREVFVVELDMPRAFALPLELLVPKRPGLRDHRPMYAVVGPGLPPPTAADLELLPEEVPEGAGVFLERNDDRAREVHFEQVMRRSSASAFARSPFRASGCVLSVGWACSSRTSCPTATR